MTRSIGVANSPEFSENLISIHRQFPPEEALAVCRIHALHTISIAFHLLPFKRSSVWTGASVRSAQAMCPGVDSAALFAESEVSAWRTTSPLHRQVDAEGGGGDAGGGGQLEAAFVHADVGKGDALGVAEAAG